MSIYTYNFAKNLSRILDISFEEKESLSDQHLDSIPIDSALANTDFISGMKWITNGKENTYIMPDQPIPTGWRYGRNYDNSYTREPKFRRKLSSIVKTHWDTSPTAADRKESVSKTMSKLWVDRYDEMAENARKNGNHGLTGKDCPNTLLLEYNGIEYYGWRELQEATGVTKHLYKKYYLRGIDPTGRIGKNGPQSKITMDIVHKGGSS